MPRPKKNVPYNNLHDKQRKNWDYCSDVIDTNANGVILGTDDLKRFYNKAGLTPEEKAKLNAYAKELKALANTLLQVNRRMHKEFFSRGVKHLEPDLD
jgi:hypothetical protein